MNEYPSRAQLIAALKYAVHFVPDPLQAPDDDIGQTLIWATIDDVLEDAENGDQPSAMEIEILHLRQRLNKVEDKLFPGT